MKHGIIRWYDVLKGHGVLVDTITLKEIFFPKETLDKLNLSHIPDKQHVKYATAEKNGVTYVSECRLIPSVFTRQYH